MTAPSAPPTSPGRGNVYACSRCERSYRFRAHPRGHLVYVHEKPRFWSREALWRQLPEVWPSTLTKFRCRCGAPLAVR